MKFPFKTISEFNDHFKDEITCYRYFEDMRWNGTPACPHCASLKTPYKVKARGKFKDIPSYRCSEKACDLPFTIRTGSALEGSKVELRKWFQAMYELSISKKGISSHELARRIGVSQKTAWFMNHRLRTMLTETNPELLTGTIEADETFVGGKEQNKHMSKRITSKRENGKRVSKTQPDKKAMVLGILQRDGKVRSIVVPNNRSSMLQPIIKENVAPASRIITDALKSYIELREDYQHVSIKHTMGNFVTKGDEHTNNIEGYWSILKRGIIGTFHSVSPKHLQLYCNEFDYRYNNRKKEMADNFATSIGQAPRLKVTYAKLTGKK